MRSTNSRGGPSGSPAERASTRQQRSRSPPIGIGDGNGHGDSSIHRSRMPVTRNRGPRRADRSNSIGSPSFHRTWIGVGPRCRKGQPNGVMPHRRSVRARCRRQRAPRARSRRPAPPRWRGSASAARPLPRSRACSLRGEPYRAPVAPRHRRFPRRPPGDPRIELLFDPSSRPRPRRDVKSDAGPPYAVSTGSPKAAREAAPWCDERGDHGTRAAPRDARPRRPRRPVERGTAGVRGGHGLPAQHRPAAAGALARPRAPSGLARRGLARRPGCAARRSPTATRAVPGQWWYEEVRRGLRGTAAEARGWLRDYFELTELHVRPDAQGSGLGEGLLRSLLDGVQEGRVLLSTPEYGATVAGPRLAAVPAHRLRGRAARPPLHRRLPPLRRAGRHAAARATGHGEHHRPSVSRGRVAR